MASSVTVRDGRLQFPENLAPLARPKAPPDCLGSDRYSGSRGRPGRISAFQNVGSSVLST